MTDQQTSVVQLTIADELKALKTFIEALINIRKTHMFSHMVEEHVGMTDEELVATLEQFSNVAKLSTQADVDTAIQTLEGVMKSIMDLKTRSEFDPHKTKPIVDYLVNRLGQVQPEFGTIF